MAAASTLVNLMPRSGITMMLLRIAVIYLWANSQSTLELNAKNLTELESMFVCAKAGTNLNQSLFYGNVTKMLSDGQFQFELMYKKERGDKLVEFKFPALIPANMKFNVRVLEYHKDELPDVNENCKDVLKSLLSGSFLADCVYENYEDHCSIAPREKYCNASFTSNCTIDETLRLKIDVEDNPWSLALAGFNFQFNNLELAASPCQYLIETNADTKLRVLVPEYVELANTVPVNQCLHEVATEMTTSQVESTSYVQETTSDGETTSAKTEETKETTTAVSTTPRAKKKFLECAGTLPFLGLFIALGIMLLAVVVLAIVFCNRRSAQLDSALLDEEGMEEGGEDEPADGKKKGAKKQSGEEGEEGEEQEDGEEEDDDKKKEGNEEEGGNEKQGFEVPPTVDVEQGQNDMNYTQLVAPTSVLKSGRDPGPKGSHGDFYK